MKILVWILVGVGALVVLGGVVIPLIHWVLGGLGWLVATALVIGGGVYLVRKLGARSDEDRLPSGR